MSNSWWKSRTSNLSPRASFAVGNTNTTSLCGILYDEAEQPFSFVFTVSCPNPLVNFVWLGCTFLMMGFAVAVWPEPSKVREPVRVRRLATVFVGAATALLGVLSAVLAFL